MYKYSPNIGPIDPGGGHLISSMSRGIIGLPSVTAKLTYNKYIHYTHNNVLLKPTFRALSLLYLPP